jgi:hypothetical protein
MGDSGASLSPWSILYNTNLYSGGSGSGGWVVTHD